MGYLFLAFIIALTTTLIFSAGLKSRGPWWLFFAVVFFASWAGALWVNPVGPVFWGIAWIPMAVVGLIFAFILAAVAAENPRKEVAGHGVSSNGRTTAVVIGSFFWLLLISLFIAIILGYSY